MSEFNPDRLLNVKALKQLSVLFNKGAVPHALLFSGYEGLGKRDTAVLFAMACNCNKSQGSGNIADIIDCTCRSCNKIRSGNHPDIHWVEPSGTFIKIDQIRELCEAVAMKPYEAGMRVVIISSAQNMNIEASNSLLKLLEEPPQKTILILTAIQASDLLPTIFSRCQTVHFTPVSQDIIKSAALEKFNISPDEAEIIAVLSQGSLSKINACKNIKGIKELICLRNWLLQMCCELTGNGARVSMETALAFAEKLSKDKKKLPDSLDIITSWLRDIMVVKYQPDRIINKDLFQNIRLISQNLSTNSLLSKLDVLQAAQQGLRTNANIRLVMEIMVLGLIKE
ncbi:DNA polymerase III, subunit delta [Desulfonema limicola]|uniref:DNA polymerase III subunit delta' n=1 Tax=Desulfonema limicola TaxID=45656 RepID=A0A975GH42_9BACT|nr:DNA polymerase III, subunit delta [Desulfonema limicola]